MAANVTFLPAKSKVKNLESINGKQSKQIKGNNV